MKLSALIDEFLDHLAKKKSPRNTIANYTRYLKRFLSFTSDIDHMNIDGNLINRYKKYLALQQSKTGNSLKENSQNYHLIALRSLLRFTLREGLNVLPVREVVLVDQGASVHKALDNMALGQLLKAPFLSSKEGLRDKAILELLYSCGVLVSELTALNRHSIDFTRGECQILGKKVKSRTVVISSRCLVSLKSYLGARKDTFKPLFIRFQGKINVDGEKMRLSDRSVQRIVAKYQKKAGLSDKVTPSSLRHSLAANLLNEGHDIKTVSKILGHKHIATTHLFYSNLII